jgi:hypothetical protein
MNLTEDQLRAVLRDAGDEIPPDQLRPLNLQSLRTSGLTAGDRTERWRRSRWLQGLAAAAAVSAVAIAATAIATGTGGHQGRTPSAVSPGAEAHVHGLPPYYAFIGSYFDKHHPARFYFATTVRDTRTGAVLATVRQPKGYSFDYAAPGAGDDSFLLLAINKVGNPAGMYLLRFSPATRGTTLTRLPIPVVPYTYVIAMSPNGTEVAVANGSEAALSGRTPSELQIYTLSGRLLRQWRDLGQICLSLRHCLSWAASGYLAFTWSNGGTDKAAEGIRVIRAAAASGSLVRASRLVVPFTSDPYNVVLSGDGATIAAAVTFADSSAFEVFSAATGKLAGRFWPSPTNNVGSVFWSNLTGSTLLVSAPFPESNERARFRLGTLTGGRFTPLLTPAAEAHVFAIAF